MDYYGRRNFGDFYRGQFSPCSLPRRHYQSSQPAVLVIQVPVPVNLGSNCFDPDTPTVAQKAKSRAQLNRDFKRRQTFKKGKAFAQ